MHRNENTNYSLKLLDLFQLIIAIKLTKKLKINFLKFCTMYHIIKKLH